MAVHDFGGDGPALVIAHATGFCGAMYEPIAAALRGRFRCIAFDLRGHGDSPPPADGDFHWGGFGADALAVIDALGLARPFGFGHSCGATALFLAEQARSGVFRGLFGYEPAMGFSSGHAAGPNAMSIGARRRRAEFDSRDALDTYLQSKALFAAFDPEVLKLYADHGFGELPEGRVRLKCSPTNEAATFEQGGSNDAFARLGEISCPVWLTYGTTPDSFGAAMGEVVAAAIPHVSLSYADGLGHLGPFTDPAPVAHQVSEAFL